MSIYHMKGHTIKSFNSWFVVTELDLIEFHESHSGKTEMPNLYYSLCDSDDFFISRTNPNAGNEIPNNVVLLNPRFKVASRIFMSWIRPINFLLPKGNTKKIL